MREIDRNSRFSVSLSINVNYEVEDISDKEILDLIKDAWQEGDVDVHAFDRKEKKIVNIYVEDGQIVKRD